MRLTSKEFLWVQAGIIFLLFVTMDGVVRGGIEGIKQNHEILYTVLSNKIQVSEEKVKFLSEVIEHGRMFEYCE
jgi:hypothetical protein